MPVSQMRRRLAGTRRYRSSKLGRQLEQPPSPAPDVLYRPAHFILEQAHVTTTSQNT